MRWTVAHVLCRAVPAVHAVIDHDAVPGTGDSLDWLPPLKECEDDVRYALRRFFEASRAVGRGLQRCTGVGAAPWLRMPGGELL